MSTVYPNREIFARPIEDAKTLTREDINQKLGGYSDDQYIKTYHPKEGGTYTIYADKPFHRKGHPFPEAIKANNEVKRLTLALFLSFFPRKRYLNHLLTNYVRLAESIYDYGKINPMLKEQYYNKLPKELWKLVYNFCLYLKIDEDISYRLGRIIATLIQYDDAYYVRLADIFTEMDYTTLLIYPRKELQKGLDIYLSREHYDLHRVVTLVKLIKIILWIPKIKNAFKSALQKVTYENLQLDDADRYFGFNRPEYDVCGNTWEERKMEFERLRKIYLTRFLKNIRLIINNNTMSATQPQIDKVIAAVSPLYNDPDFAAVTDISVSITQNPPVPAPEVDQVDVPKP